MSFNPFEMDEAPDEKISFAELRKRGKEADRTALALQAERDELLARRDELAQQHRSTQIRQEFKAAGLNPKWAALYEARHPEGEVTPESVQDFASTNLLGGPQEPEPEPGTTGFDPFTTGVGPESAMVSREEMERMLHEGRFDELNRLSRAGRIETLPKGDDGQLQIDWLGGVAKKHTFRPLPFEGDE